MTFKDVDFVKLNNIKLSLKKKSDLNSYEFILKSNLIFLEVQN